ncbi:nitroreductase family protein [Candidatus Pacearchaeota archaeon]|nr:nitroreductase family protein [Candidatus Pacearchaeota archaeon]
MTKPYKIENERKPEHDVNEIFIKRWSPRSIDKKNFTHEELMSLFEAARWAPSSFNIQPWRFLYSMNGDENWATFFGLLAEFNQIWTKDAGALVVVLSKKTNNEGKPNALHSFDTGSAWMSLALQARMKNLIAHGMAGFDYEKAKDILNVPDDYNVEAMLAVGTQGEVENLHERMQKSEKPNERKYVKEFTFKGKFPKIE